AAPQLGNAELGPGHAARVALLTGEVAGLFQLPGMDAQVAVRGADHTLELVEGEGFVDRERAQDGETQALVDQPVHVERARRRSGGHAGRPLSAPRTSSRGAIGLS